LLVDVEGNITTCCLDSDLKNKIGNLSEMDLFEALNSEKLKRWRQAQLEGRFEDSGPHCMECNYLAAEQMTEDEVSEITKDDE